jgi:Holliday junction resolvase RusA-like endonuclease
MTYKVIISSKNGKFPLKGLNELLNGRLYNFRTKKYHNSVKSENDKVCRLAIQKYMHGVKIDKPIRCTYYIYAQDKRHDRSNLYSSVEKSFLDAMQEVKCIKNDGFLDVLDSEFHTEVDKYNPRVEVIIEEV